MPEPSEPATTTSEEATAIAVIGHALDILDWQSRLRVLDLLVDRYYKPTDKQPS